MLVSAAAPSTAESFDYLFDIRLGIAKIGEMRITGKDEAAQYSTTGKLYTTGLAGAVYDLEYTYSAKGNSTNPWHVLPLQYAAEIHENGYDRTVNIRYSGDRIAAITTDPSSPEPANMNSQHGTVDPMTLIYLLVRPVPAESVCGGSYELYDGATRFTVTYVNARRFNDGRVECDVDYAGQSGNAGVSVSGITYVPGDDGRMYIRSFTVQTNAGALKATRS